MRCKYGIRVVTDPLESDVLLAFAKARAGLMRVGFSQRLLAAQAAPVPTVFEMSDRVGKRHVVRMPVLGTTRCPRVRRNKLRLFRGTK